MYHRSRYLALWFFAVTWPFILLVACSGKIFSSPTSSSTPFLQTQTSSTSGDIQRYYPQRKYAVRWYVVKDLQTGKMVDFISFTPVGQITLDNGRTLSLLENRNAEGMNIDYEEITAEQVLLHRLVLVHQGTASDTLRDTSFTPPLPLLRAPLEVGRSWSENIPGDKSYIYRVESRMTVSALGKNWQDCLRVVRTRGGNLDYKTEYCPELGIAAFEILTPEGKWLRAELAAIESELDLIGVRVAAGRCEYILDPLGFLPGEILTVTVIPPALQPLTFQRPSAENIHLSLGADAPLGKWLMKVQGKQQTASSVLVWTGACRASFLTPPPSLKPSLTLIGQEADKQGQINYIIAGSGWKAGETLSFTQAGPGWHQQTTAHGQANEEGVSAAAIVPFIPNPLPGKYTLTMQGETQTAILTITCREDGLCFGPIPRLIIPAAK